MRISDWSSDVCSSDLHFDGECIDEQIEDQNREDVDQRDDVHLDFAAGHAELALCALGGALLHGWAPGASPSETFGNISAGMPAARASAGAKRARSMILIRSSYGMSGSSSSEIGREHAGTPGTHAH